MAKQPSTQLARRLRRNATDVEALFWSKVRNKQINGAKFKRQVRIDRYVVDFLCFERRLVIEIDGGQHAEQEEHDKTRTSKLEALGYRVLRFWNNDVNQNIEGVLAAVAEALKART